MEVQGREGAMREVQGGSCHEGGAGWEVPGGRTELEVP